MGGGFWNSETVLQRVPKEELIVPFDQKGVRHGAYELAVGPHAFLTSQQPPTRIELGDVGQLVIPPGQLALLITEEVVKVPADAIGFISIRAGIKFSGIVNVSGFHVDPGFEGRLKFTVYNAGSRNLVLQRKQRIFLMWFSSLVDVTGDLYKGDHQKQLEITPEDQMKIAGDIASPGVLKEGLETARRELEQRIQHLESRVTLLIGIASSLVVATILFAATQTCKRSPVQKLTSNNHSNQQRRHRWSLRRTMPGRRTPSRLQSPTRVHEASSILR